jgi:hypothetical protein
MVNVRDSLITLAEAEEGHDLDIANEAVHQPIRLWYCHSIHFSHHIF